MRHSNPFNELAPETVNEIRLAVGTDNVITEPEILNKHDRDASDLRAVPGVMVMARSAVQIGGLLKLANKRGFSVVPRAGATGLAGGCLPIQGGVVLNMSEMDRILAIDTSNIVAEVEPGVITQKLRDAARKKGLFYPPDPAGMDRSTIGGNAATSAGGPSCLKYGTTKEYVLGLEVVLPNGRIIQTGAKTRKAVVGYDLTHLFVGAEGTLGVITRLVLKLIPHPETAATMTVMFEDLKTAMSAITEIQVRGHLPCALEFMDAGCLQLLSDLMEHPMPSDRAAMVIVEVDGTQAQTEAELSAIMPILKQMGATNMRRAENETQREALWGARRRISTRIHDASVINKAEDISVPIGKIADLADSLPDLEKRFGLKLFAFGHAGDGNIHVNITSQLSDNPNIDACIRELFKITVEMNGTISGEHGIGYAKKTFVPMELSRESIRIQKGIKKLFDPKNILNPGKIFDLSKE